MISQKDFEKETILDIAKKMALAARTAPKGRGRDTLDIMIAEKSDINKIADHMDKIYKEKDIHFFGRDAANIRDCEAILFIGTSIEPLNLAYCGWCGFEDCKTKNEHRETPCTFNNIDLGIAIGSAVSIAANNRIDNRVLYSAGKAVRELKMMSENTKIILGIALSVSSKNIFFDRK